ncbi:MAG: ATP-binding protein, partial [Myxococcota bacterium]
RSVFHAPLTQAMVDVAMLTVLLWSAGGLETPFWTFYIFHVALVAILGGIRWLMIAVAISLAGVGFLALSSVVPVLRIASWNPVEPLGVVADGIAFVLTLVGAAYIIAHAVRDLKTRELELEEARDRAALDYRLLSNTLEGLEAGLEVIDAKGHVTYRNRLAARISERGSIGEKWRCAGHHGACERDATGLCPIEALKDDELAPARCRFAAKIDDEERVYEMLSLPIEEDDRVMNLYLDRTEATMAEARLILAERLASLGRVAQGVAHELNTPLATIRTLATDMRQVIGDLDATGEVARDLDESAALIRDETRRLGRITPALLAGGDLVRARTEGELPLSAAVERARAIVTAGQSEERIVVDESVALRTEADGDRLVQVLVNLFQNALDASRETRGKVRVYAEEMRISGAGDAVLLVVQDEGSGIDPAMEGRLFEPFSTTKPPGEGTGLGLYMSYMIVQAMGGSLSLRNREGGGAVAYIQLPRRVSAVPSEQLVPLTKKPASVNPAKAS